MEGDEGLTSLLQSIGSEIGQSQRLFAFPMIDSTCRREMVLNESQDLLARAIHKTYVRNRELEGRSGVDDPNMVRWELLSEEMKDSNRQQADHIPVKLRAIDCLALAADKERPALFEFEPEEIELLASMEHARWTAERLLAGWKYDPKTRDVERKISPHLVSWEQLPEEVREFDRAAVRAIPEFLSKAGVEIRRKGSVPSRPPELASRKNQLRGCDLE
jgi:hypothetical protein